MEVQGKLWEHTVLTDMEDLEVVDRSMDTVAMLHQEEADIREEVHRVLTLSKVVAEVHTLKEHFMKKLHLPFQAAMQVCQQIQE